MAYRHFVSLWLILGAICGAVVAQEPTKPASAPAIDFPAFVKETQQSPNQPGYAGLVWWIPSEFWVIASERSGVSEDKATERYAPLKKYTVVAIAVGKIGIGNINWISEPEIRDATTLRDSEGNVYQPVQKLSGDAEGLVSVLKAVFGNMLGSMGQNIQVLFFPATNKMAKPIADPHSQGSFSVVITKLVDGKDQVFEWKLPLTTLSPPKYCPAGKERVQANWKYCPWHGVKLDDAEPAAAPAPK
jgi:hypothetical protein